jgi:hypothetical protein
MFGVPFPGDLFQMCHVHLVSSAPPTGDPHHNAFVQVSTAAHPAVTTHRPPLQTENPPSTAGPWFHASRDKFTLRVHSDIRPFNDPRATRLPFDAALAHQRYIREDYHLRKSATFFRGE